MNRTEIEWVKNPDGTRGITVNSKTGCLNGCEYCYARKLANGRLKPLYLANKNYAPIKGISNKEYGTLVGGYSDPFYPRLWSERLEQIRKIKKPTGIFLDNMSDWMGDYWPKEWTEAELQMMRDCSQHRFYTLTKQPQNLIKFSPFPEDCWVGGTATNTRTALETCLKLGDIQATVKFLSIEPFLNSINLPPELLKTCGIGWLIIGACTGSKTELLALVDRLEVGKEKSAFTLMPWGKKWTLQPPIEWVEEIVKAADKAGVKVFLKKNLAPLVNPMKLSELGVSFAPFYTKDLKLRQELPDEKT